MKFVIIKLIKGGSTMKGYEKLTEQQQALFNRVHSSHLKAMGTDKRKEYEGNVKAVKWDKKERCLKVYFTNGDWWHYFTNGTWG